jgi:DNA-binding transcriptional MerR regulator
MPPAQPSLLRIGPFSHLARVSIKTLRFYDSAGLFPPAWVDPRSGYRFYSATQLPLLRRIRMLGELGCSLGEIRRLTTSNPHGQISHAEVAVLRRRLMVRVAQAELRLRQLDALTAPAPMVAGQPLEVQQLAAIPAFTLRESVRAGGSDIQRMFESAERKVARLGLRAQESPFLLLHDMEYHRPQTDVEVCVPTRHVALGQAGVRLIEPVARAACVRFNGEYEQAPVLFDATLECLHRRHERIAGPIREVYLRFGADQRGYALDPRCITSDPRLYRTELLIPVSR